MMSMMGHVGMTVGYGIKKKKKNHKSSAMRGQTDVDLFPGPEVGPKYCQIK